MTDEDQLKRGIASMSLYYENLERVLKGEIWFFPDADPAKYEAANFDLKQTFDYFRTLASFLCFDFDMVKTEFVKPCILFSLFITVEMPASVLIDLYLGMRSSKDPADRFRLRREHKRRVIETFIKELHTW